MIIETQRLKLIPLTHNQLKLYLEQNILLNDELEIKINKLDLHPELSEAIEQTLLPNTSAQKKNYLHCTLWAMILIENNVMIGSFLFADTPNAAGEIEIGYGIDVAYRNRGYLSETLAAVAAWTKTQPEIKMIIAQTDENNLPSVQALIKNKFVQYKKQESQVWFKYDC
ncbi:MAG: GNAT family N-acetyltransferase [Bacteroidia bacterium]